MSSVSSSINSWPSELTAPNGLSHSTCPKTHGAASPTHELREWRGDRYEIRGELGRGGGGIVYHAWDKHLEREVVIKTILDPKSNQAVARFQREAKITASLFHPGIVPVHELGIDPVSGSLFYAMQKIAGQTLDQVLQNSLPTQKKASGPVRAELLQSFTQVCRIVGFAHSQKIIHRDLKPSNICVGEFGEVFVLDWGIAKQLRLINSCDKYDIDSDPSSPTDSSRNELTQTGDSIGTISYMSPEQASKRPFDVKESSDVYSLGIILYEILTGTHPFRCPTPEETREHIIRSEFIPVRRRRSSIPRPLSAICERSLSANPEHRYANGSELADDMDRFLSQQKVMAYQESWYESVDRFANRHRAWFWAVLITSTFVTCASIAMTALVHRAKEVEHQAKVFAEQEHEAKKKALECEQIAHMEAITQLQSARDSIDTWIAGLDQDLANYPGLNQMRQSLLDRARLHYQQLTSKLTDSPLMNLEVARAQIRLGDVFYMRHQMQQSQAHYQRAIALLMQDCFTDGSDWFSIQQSQLALAQTGLARVQLEQHGNVESSQKLLSSSIAILNSIDPVDHQFIPSRRTLAVSYLLKAHCETLSHEDDQAEISFHQAISSLRSQSQTDPFFHDFRTEAEIQRSFAEWKMAQGELTAASDAYDSVIRCYDKLLEQGRDRPDWLESRASAKLTYASCLKKLLNPNEAIVVFESAEEDLRRAWKIFSSESTHREKESTIYSGIGLSLILLGDPKQAESVLQLSLNSLSKAEHQADSGWIQQKLQTKLWIAAAKIEQFQDVQDVELTELETLLHQAAQMSLHQSSYRDLLYQWRWLKSTVDLRNGHLEIAEQDLTEWISDIDDLTAFQDNITREFCDSPLRLVFLGKLLRNLALIQQMMHRPNQALKTIEKARIAFSTAKECGGQSAALAGFSLIQLWCESQHSDLSKTDVLQLAKALVEEHPSSPNAWYWMAEMAWRSGQTEEARFAMNKVNRLRRQLTIDDMLLSNLILDQKLQAETIQNEIAQRFGVETPPMGTHARFLLQAL